MNRINISEEQKDTCICLLLRINDYLEIIQPVANNYIFASKYEPKVQIFKGLMHILDVYAEN